MEPLILFFFFGVWFSTYIRSKENYHLIICHIYLCAAMLLVFLQEGV